MPVFAPAGELDPSAGRLAAFAAAAGLVACVLVLLSTTIVLVRRAFQAPVAARGWFRALRWVPWEAGVIALAMLSWRRLASGALVVQPQTLPRIDAVALMFQARDLLRGPT